MQTNTNSTESKTTSTPPTTIPKPPGVQDTPPVEVDNRDDFGYEIVKETPAKENDEPPKATDEEKIKNPATGYGKKPEEVPPVKKDESAKEEEKKGDETPPADEEKVKTEITEALKGLPEGVDRENVTKFALENKLTKEQAAAYAKFVSDNKALVEEQQKEHIKTTRENWEKELKEDPDFGGENYDLNLDRAEKVLEKYFPNTKKVLTERGSMLPPYTMKDFYALSKVLNPKAPLVHGDPGSSKDEESHLDVMYK